MFVKAAVIEWERMHGDRDVFFAILGLRARCCRICGICRLFGMAVFCVCSIGDGNSDRRTREGNRLFSGLKLGDASHLYAGNEPVSVAARFCEVYSDMNSRH